MIDLYMTIYGVTGLALFEILRCYTALMSGLVIIPDKRYGAYLVTLIGFTIATAVCVNLFAGASEIAAVLFGFTLPNGLHWTINSSNSELKNKRQKKDKPNPETGAETIDDQIDDFFEDDSNEAKINQYHTNKSWLQKYYMR